MYYQSEDKSMRFQELPLFKISKLMRCLGLEISSCFYMSGTNQRFVIEQ